MPIFGLGSRIARHAKVLLNYVRQPYVGGARLIKSIYNRQLRKWNQFPARCVRLYRRIDQPTSMMSNHMGWAINICQSISAYVDNTWIRIDNKAELWGRTSDHVDYKLQWLWNQWPTTRYQYQASHIKHKVPLAKYEFASIHYQELGAKCRVPNTQ